MVSKGVVVLDFDGVIGDSVHECYIQSINAYHSLGGKLKDTPQTEAAFRAGRPLVTKAPHYFTILSMIESNPSIKFDFISQAQFNAKVAEHTQIGAEFEKKFMVTRKIMQANDPKGWLGLQKSFPRVVPFLIKLAKKNQLFISTTKDTKSVIDLLRQYKLNIPSDRIYAKEISADKKVHLTQISEKTGVPLKKIVFVEDMPEQIRAVKQLGVRGILVPWGYSTKAQRTAARKQKIPLLGTGKKELRKIKRFTKMGRA